MTHESQSAPQWSTQRRQCVAPLGDRGCRGHCAPRPRTSNLSNVVAPPVCAGPSESTKEQSQNRDYVNNFIESYLVKNDRPSLSQILDDGLLKVLIKKDALKKIKNINQLKKIIKKEFFIDKNNHISK